MNSEEIEEFRRRMEEVAVLPHGAPERQAVLRHVSQADSTIEQEWLKLVREDEQLRLDLARAALPSDLEYRLLAIPGQTRMPGRWLLPRSLWLSAAAAVLVLAFSLWGIVAARSHRQARTLDGIAILTMASHESQPQLAVTSADWEVVKTAVQNSVSFPVDRPKLDPTFKLIGGRVIKLAGTSMIYTRWESRGKTYSLYQFCGKDFSLRAPVSRQLIDRQLTPTTRCNVLVWTEAHCDYALLVDGETAPQHGPNSI
ncbi:MAG: hypothetical protein SGJ19_23760 [Planctomycetia bacterium]|nr:hypothetical protein [Planctomycetia bacterium]